MNKELSKYLFDIKESVILRLLRISSSELYASKQPFNLSKNRYSGEQGFEILAKWMKIHSSGRAFFGLDQNALRNSIGEAIKKYLCLTEGSFKNFQRNQLNFSNFDHSLELFASFLFQDKKEESVRLEDKITLKSYDNNFLAHPNSVLV